MALLSIVLLPDNKTSRFVISLSKKLSSESNTFFTLDGEKLYPHITLSDIRSSDENIPAIKNGLAGFAKGFKPFDVALSDFVEDRKWFGWNCVKSASISKLHGEAVRYMAKSKGRPLKRAGLFRPHITITRYRKRSDLKMAFAVIRSRKVRFTARYIALCKKSQHGTVTKIIAKFKLGKN